MADGAEAFCSAADTSLKAKRNVTAIIAGMRTHASHKAAQARACAALWSLAAQDKQLIARAGGSGALMAAVSTHSQDLEVLEQGLGALWSLAADADSKTDIMSHLPAVLSLMHSHNADAMVQEKCLGIIWQLGTIADNKRTLASAGTISATLAAMRAFMQHAAGVLEQACGVIMVLAKAKEARKDLVAEGAIELLVEALRAHPQHDGVAAPALGGLMNLGGRPDAELQVKIAAAGSIPLIMAAMRAHKSKAVQMRGSGAVRVLARGSAENQLALFKAGAIPVLLEAMRTLDDPDALERACGALRDLACTSDTHAEIAAGGALLLQAVHHFPAHAALQKEAQSTLQALSKSGHKLGHFSSAASVAPEDAVTDAWSQDAEAGEQSVENLASVASLAQTTKLAAQLFQQPVHLREQQEMMEQLSHRRREGT